MKHVAHFLRVEDQDALEEDDVRWVDRDPLVQPENTQADIFNHRVMILNKNISWKRREMFRPTWNE